MFNEIFNFQSYSWNPYAVPMFVTALLVFLEGFGVYIKNPNAITNKMYCLWLIFVTVWLCGVGMIYLSKEAIVASFWYRNLGFIGTAFIPLGSYLFSLTFLTNTFTKKRWFIFLYALTLSIFYLISVSTNLITKEMKRFFWGLYPVYDLGITTFLFMGLWISLYLLTVINLIKAYKESTGIKKKQMLLILWGTIFVYSGAVDFFPAFGIDVYPFGYISVILYFTLIAYVIIRYRAFEIDTVIHRTLLWMATSLWLVIPSYFLFKYTRYWLQSLSTFWLTISALGLFYLFLWYYRYFQPKIDHLFRRRKYDYQAILSKTAEKIATTINMEELTRKLLSEVCETMYLRTSLLYVLSKDEKRYLLVGRRGYKEIEGIRQRGYLEFFSDSNQELKDTEPVYRLIREERQVIEKEQLELNPRYKEIKDPALRWFTEQEIELAVPLVLENKVNAILCLGRKDNLRAYTSKDIKLLKKLGEEAGVTLYNALHYKDLLEKDRLEEELRLGRDIQISLLPKESPRIPNLAICGLMLPAKEIGGDYYDFITFPGKEELGIVIGDVSGKGVGAGLIMATAKATLKGLSQHELSPKQILCRTNDLLYEYTAGQKFMTMLYFKYDPKDKTLTYSSAGHEHILVYRHGNVEAIMSGGFMLGMLQNIDSYLQEHSITLGTGDKILLYTDGVTDADNTSGERFGLERLKASFKTNSSKEPFDMINAIKSEVYQFIGTQPQYDDITLVGMEAE